MTWHTASRRLWLGPSLISLVLVVLLFVKPELHYNEPFIGFCLFNLVLLMGLLPWRGER